ncbi:helix-turn-helix transcriptional regulator, partial [Hoeflea alexandrii]|uniref:helix-turn-helix transcriptional regulator n=1 Tax=Hoeflea alexandrii TaxID=288436 RepID=UPI0022AFBCF7
PCRATPWQGLMAPAQKQFPDVKLQYLARMLGIAPSTVRNQTQSIYDKLGVNSRAGLASMFARP